MNSKYGQLWLLLTLALVLFVGVSFIDSDKLDSWSGGRIRQAPFREHLLATENDSVPGVPISENPMDVPDSIYRPEPVPVDSAGQSLLVIGDSMTLNIALRMAEYAKQNGHTIHAVNWDSSNTKIWASCDTLDSYISKYDVTYVFISLGSNELYLKNPQSRKPYVETILAKIGELPYVWIGPPNWKEDAGINDMLEATCRPGSFFRSAGMEFERKKDHVHPTRRASALWVDSIMRWMPKSSHPILAEVPSDSIGRAPANVTYLKALNK